MEGSAGIRRSWSSRPTRIRCSTSFFFIPCLERLAGDSRWYNTQKTHCFRSKSELLIPSYSDIYLKTVLNSKRQREFLFDFFSLRSSQNFDDFSSRESIGSDSIIYQSVLRSIVTQDGCPKLHVADHTDRCDRVISTCRCDEMDPHRADSGSHSLLSVYGTSFVCR